MDFPELEERLKRSMIENDHITVHRSRPYISWPTFYMYLRECFGECETADDVMGAVEVFNSVVFNAWTEIVVPDSPAGLDS